MLEIKQIEDRVARVFRRHIEKTFSRQLEPLRTKYERNQIKLRENPPEILSHALQAVTREIQEAPGLRDEKIVEAMNKEGDELVVVKFSEESINNYVEGLRQKRVALTELINDPDDAELRKKIASIEKTPRLKLKKVRFTRANPNSAWVRRVLKRFFCAQRPAGSTGRQAAALALGECHDGPSAPGELKYISQTAE